MKKKVSRKKKQTLISLLKKGNKKWIKATTIGVLILAVVIIIGAIKMFASSITITSPADGSTIDGIQTFSGMATAGSTVDIYSRIASHADDIHLTTGADPFTLTYQATNPNPGNFSDNFSSINGNYWGPETHDSGTANAGSSGLTTIVTGANSTAVLHTSESAAFDLSGAPKPLYLETNLTTNSASGSGYSIQFAIDNCVSGSPSCISAGIYANDSGISYSSDDGVHSSSGNLTVTAPAIGQKMKLRIEINADNTIQFKLATTSGGPFNHISPMETFSPWSERTRINIGVNNSASTGSVSTTWDALDTILPLAPIPAGYILPNIPLNYNSADYNGQAIFLGSNIGTQAAPGGIIPESFLSNKDIYVYLADIPGIGKLTLYSDATPTVWASTVVPALSGILSGTFTTDAYMLAFAHPASGTTYTPAGLPVPSLGSITESSMGDPGTIHLLNNGVDTLLATTTASPSGNWSTNLTPALLRGIYTIVAKSSPDGESAPITIIIPPPPPPTYSPEEKNEPIGEGLPAMTLDEALDKIKDLEKQNSNLETVNKACLDENAKLQLPQQQPSVTPPTPVVENIYTVIRGDTLLAIARRLYNNAASYTKLIDINKYRYPALEFNPNVIEIGWQFNY